MGPDNRLHSVYVFTAQYHHHSHLKVMIMTFTSIVIFIVLASTLSVMRLVGTTMIACLGITTTITIFPLVFLTLVALERIVLQLTLLRLSSSSLKPPLYTNNSNKVCNLQMRFFFMFHSGVYTVYSTGYHDRWVLPTNGISTLSWWWGLRAPETLRAMPAVA
jgi:hypothetical protein